MIREHQQQTSERTETARRQRIDVLCAVDDNYAMPLAVTLHSAVRSLSPDAELHVFLIDGGLGEASWMALRESLANLPIDFTVIQPDLERVNDLAVSHHITHTAYYRLLAADLLPDSLDRVLYLDSDLLVRDDLCGIWNQEFDGSALIAVQDIACPFIDAREGSPNFRRSCPYMATLRPIPNFRELNLDGREPYFNSGVMLINLQQWRDDNLGSEMLECLSRNSRHVWCWDQYALNVVLHGRWKQLPLRWNAAAHVFEYPSAEQSPIDQGQFAEMLDNPAILHFTTEFKPWHYVSSHPLRELFFEALDETAWAGWRPARPPMSVHQWWQRRAVQIQKHATIALRRARYRWS